MLDYKVGQGTGTSLFCMMRKRQLEEQAGKAPQLELWAYLSEPVLSKAKLQGWDTSCSSNKLTLYVLAENLQTSLQSGYLFLHLFILLILWLSELFHSLCSYYISCFNIKEHAYFKGSYYFKGMKLKPEEIAGMQRTICLAALVMVGFMKPILLRRMNWMWMVDNVI